jgi:glycosyltransferase involved in cell wall biosynthesis
MNLMVFNLATDADDPVLGFTTDWINRLAARFDHIDVITMRAGRLAVAPNVRVYSVGKERGYSDARRVLAFYRALTARLSRRRYAACFAHMMPLFALMGAPLLWAWRVPITLWYTHRQQSRVLRWAERVSARVVTAAPDSFPFPTAKLRVLGHGIDTEFFSPATGSPPRDPLHNVVQVARLMPIKRQATLIRAAAVVPGMRAVLVGDVPPEIDAAYKHELEALAAASGIVQRVVFAGAQNRVGVRAALWHAALAVNLSPPGLFDKAALESMAAGVPTIVSSAAFRPVLGDYAADLLIDDAADDAALAQRITTVLAKPQAERARMAAHIRQRVIEQHSIDGLMDRLTRVLRDGEPQ